MALISWLLRKRQSKGYGVHSPFAFNLITQVLYSPYGYYAFADIANRVGYDPYEECNQMLFRLVNHFKPKRILEINPGDGISTQYILAPSSKTVYTSVEADKLNVFDNETILREKFDALFINLDSENNFVSSLDRLFEISNENTFWVINNINSKGSKQLWRCIVNDARINVTFDYKNRTGIAFLRSAFYKQHYRV